MNNSFEKLFKLGLENRTRNEKALLIVIIINIIVWLFVIIK